LLEALVALRHCSVPQLAHGNWGNNFPKEQSRRRQPLHSYLRRHACR